MGDFGFATKVEPPKSVDAKQRAKTVLGTPLWMAPEIHRREQYSSAVDIWAMGIVALEMAEVRRKRKAFFLFCGFVVTFLQGVPPYKGMNREEIREQVKTNGAGLKVCLLVAFLFNFFFNKKKTQDPGLWSAEFNDFVEQCLTMDADQRPSAEQLLKHPFLKKASERLQMPKVEKKKKDQPDDAADNDKLDAGDE